MDIGNEVIIAADGGPLALLQKKFPECKFIVLKGTQISYSKWMVLSMIFQIPKILFSIFKEHQTLKKIIEEEQIEMVISDNRYGLWNKKITSIFITHQINIQAPAFEKLLFKINCWFISNYDECWVPDYAEEKNLSGDLSHPKNIYYKKNFPKNIKYIGPKSRFSKGVSSTQKIYTCVGIVSGPEPQRTVFFEKLKSDFQKTKGKTLLISGKPETEKKVQVGELTIVDHLPDDEFLSALYAAEKIICRSGYSSIMDLHVLGLSAEFIATPGQTEQEYLAAKLRIG
ncbi:MAG: glycosyltransferase [Bacteroidetes bacterium]|nr:glycosyltransferase [Bacteroidota bacterium]